MTTADPYCTRKDVIRRLPPGAVTSPAGLIASCLKDTDVITYDGHGFETDDELTVRAIAGGTLAAPLVAGTVYFAIRLTNATFQLAETAGGPAINLTSDGVSMMVTREPAFDEFIEYYSRWFDAFLPAEDVPLKAPIHPTAKGIVADLVAKRILNVDGKDSAAVNTAELAAKAQAERFAAGMQLRGAAVPTSPSNLAVSMSGMTDPRGWGRDRLP